MPAQPRPSGLGKKIVYKILGKPANLAFKRNGEQRFVNRRLFYEESSRVK